jgi:hypothetical protein
MSSTQGRAKRAYQKRLAEHQTKHHENHVTTGKKPPQEATPWEPPIALVEVPEADPFPTEVLPALLARFVEEVALAKNCPPDYVGVPLLVIAGAAIGATRALEIKPGWRERPCIYAAVIGSPGSAKTPALKAVALPVYAEQSKRLAYHRRRLQSWEESSDQDKGPAPKLETVFVSDITLEKLAAILQDNSRGVFIIRDELTGWIGGMDQYRAKGKGADRQAYLSIWAGEPIRVDRKGEQLPVYVAHPFVGVIGGLVPALLPRLQGEKDIWDGFLDRVLLAYPAPLPAKAEDWLCLADETVSAWKEVLDQLWQLEAEDTEDGEKRPRLVRLSRDGRHEWERFTAGLAAELNRKDLADTIKGHLAKFRGYGARLGLILHLLRRTCKEIDTGDVDDESVRRAGRLIEYFRSHCLKVHAALGSDPEIENARRVLEWIERERRTRFKRYDVFEDVKNEERFPRIEDLDRPLDRLEKHRVIRRQPVEEKGRGRPSAPVFEVNPAVYPAS